MNLHPNRRANSFTVTVGGRTYRGMTKKEAMFRVVQYLCASGIYPDAFPKFPNRRLTQTWCSVEGNVDGSTFRERAREQLTALRKPIDGSRWFWGDGELIYVGNRTYAFSAKWGPTTEAAFVLLQQTFPLAGISYSADEPG